MFAARSFLPRRCQMYNYALKYSRLIQSFKRKIQVKSTGAVGQGNVEPPLLWDLLAFPSPLP